MVLSLEQFVRNLAASGLVSADELEALQQAIPPEKRPKAAEELGKLLVQRGKLTTYQAQAVWLGKTKGLVIGEYVVLDKLGEGGMGVVLKARHRHMDRLVALKMISGTAVGSPDAVKRFYREVKAAARLTHRNIVIAYDAGEHEGLHYLAMELVEGKDLAALVREQGPLTVAQALDYVVQAARGLAYAHGLGIVHRDIKPSNLLVDKEGTVKILDMGLARLTEAQGDESGEQPLTNTGQIMGTIDYMSPEQAEDTRRADERSDIYSLGCTLYHLLTRRPLYEGDTAVKKLLAHRLQPIPSLRVARPDVTEELDAVLARMIAKQPADRYPSMIAAMADLEACKAGRPATVGAPRQSILALPDQPDAGGSVNSWLEKITEGGLPAMPAAAQAVEPTIARRAEDATCADAAQRPFPAGPKQRMPWIVGAGVASGLAAVLILVLVATMLRGGKAGGQPGGDEEARRAGDVSRDSPSGMAKASLGRSNSSMPPPETVTEPWTAAWEQTDAKARLLVSEQRFAEAIQEYNGLLDQFQDLTLLGRVNETVKRLEDLAGSAYGQAEAQARKSLGEKNYTSARAALRPVVEDFGLAVHADAARKLLAEIEAAEKAVVAPPPSSLPSTSPGQPVAQEELHRHRQLEARWREALKPAEQRAASWDFRGAAVELNKVRFEDAELVERLAQRRNELKRMHDLKQKLITAINQASPRVKKTALGIKGLGGELTQSDEDGLAATLVGGKTETIPWTSIQPSSLVRLFASKQSKGLLGGAADDWLAAGLVALALGSPSEAERYLAQARSLGSDTNPYVSPLVAAAFAEAAALLDKREFSAAEVALSALEEKYASMPWLASHKAVLSAARSMAKGGIHETEAEKLYTEAVELFHEKEFFDLKRLVEQLKTSYATAAPVTDPARNPPLSDLEKATLNLGKFITVRLDGKGDFKSIQEAVDAAPAKSLIEIQDAGPYNEKLQIDKEGITLRGEKGTWPVITSVGKTTDFPMLVTVNGIDVRLRGLVLAHGGAAGNDNSALFVPGGKLVSLRSMIIWGGDAVRVWELSMANCLVFPRMWFYEVRKVHLAAKDCLFAGGIHCYGWERPDVEARVENCLIGARCDIWNGMEFYKCTCSEGCNLAEGPRALIRDSIFPFATANRADGLIEYCNAYGEQPYRGQAKAGKGCFQADPAFLDPKNLDFRLAAKSPCRGRASDGGDVGCRYTPEMIALLKAAVALRTRGIIRF